MDGFTPVIILRHSEPNRHVPFCNGVAPQIGLMALPLFVSGEDALSQWFKQFAMLIAPETIRAFPQLPFPLPTVSPGVLHACAYG